jgi:hypothetical protein
MSKKMERRREAVNGKMRTKGNLLDTLERDQLTASPNPALRNR